MSFFIFTITIPISIIALIWLIRNLFRNPKVYKASVDLLHSSTFINNEFHPYCHLAEYWKMVWSLKPFKRYVEEAREECKRLKCEKK